MSYTSLIFFYQIKLDHLSFLIKIKARMSEQVIEIHNLYTEMENHLRLLARNEPRPAQLINLRMEYRNGLWLADRENSQFSVNEGKMSAFSEILNDKFYKLVSLYNCEFSLVFVGMKCQKIYLSSQHVIFYSAKKEKKEFKGRPFKVKIFQKGVLGIQNFSEQLNGYLNRLGKRFLCSQSYFAGQKVQSLVDFIAVRPKQLKKISHKPQAKSQKASIDSLAALNAGDREIMEKLRNFITRQQIYEFALEQVISEEGIAELQKLALGEK